MTERFRDLSGEAAREAAALLAGVRTLHLATRSAAGEPEASYAPFVRAGDNAFHVCVSDLSRHTAHLAATGRASVLLIEDESAAGQLFARRRLVFDCGAAQVGRDTARWRTVMDLFEHKFGEVARLIRPLRDFRLFALAPRRGRFVEGFARAFRIEGPALDALRRVNDTGSDRSGTRPVATSKAPAPRP